MSSPSGGTPDERWTAVDEYFEKLLIAPDAALNAALASSNDANLPAIAVSAAQGKLLMLLAQMIGAKRILEIGTLGGYSTIWLARALPAGGKLITLEYEPKHAEIARANLSRAGLDGVVDVRIGKALDTLPKLQAEKVGPFDLVFIDADKISTAEYLQWALRLSRPGSVIIVDNVVRQGKVTDAKSEDTNVQGIRRFAQILANEPRLSATAIQTVGNKGYDGLVIARVIA